MTGQHGSRQRSKEKGGVLCKWRFAFPLVGGNVALGTFGNSLVTPTRPRDRAGA